MNAEAEISASMAMAPAGPELWQGRPEHPPITPFVQAGAIYASRRRGVLIADGLAARKTALLSSHAHIERRRKAVGSALILVICPKENGARWRAKFHKYHAFPQQFLSSETPLPDDAQFGEDDDIVRIVTWGKLLKQKDLLAHAFDLLIVDGVERAARATFDRGSKRGAMVLGNPRTGERGIRAWRKVFISPEPFRKSPLEVFAVGNALCPGVHGAFMDFSARHLHMEWRPRYEPGSHRGVERLRAAGEEFGESRHYLRSDRSRYLDEYVDLQAHIRQHYMLRRPQAKVVRLANPKGRISRKGRSYFQHAVLDKNIF